MGLFSGFKSKIQIVYVSEKTTKSIFVGDLQEYLKERREKSEKVDGKL